MTIAFDRFPPRPILAALALSSLVACGAAESSDLTVLDSVGYEGAALELAEGEEIGSASQALRTPSGLGRYCSMTLNGAWGFAVSTNLVDNPCQWLRDNVLVGVVQRAGLWSVAGFNHVVARCDAGQSFVSLRKGTGSSPLGAAFSDAQGHSNCIFTVAPRELPIFRSPFAGSPTLRPRTGFDFARAPYDTVNMTQFVGRGLNLGATMVSYEAFDRSNGPFIDDHRGYDWNVSSGRRLVAVADGRVLAARFRDRRNTNCSPKASNTEGEVFIEHVVSGGAGVQFDERFVSRYSHLSRIDVDAGDPVTKGTQIGLSGNTGCSSEAHLHFEVYRTTNTAGFQGLAPTIRTDFSGTDQRSTTLQSVSMIDPYGFYGPGPNGFDPWGWRAFPQGALSINLWDDGEGLPTGDW